MEKIIIKELKEKACEIFNNIKKAFENYKITLLTIVLLTLFETVAWLMYIESVGIPFDDDAISRVFLIFGVAAAFIETYFREKKKGKIAAFLLAAAIACIASFNMELKNDSYIMQMSGELIKDITYRLLGGYVLLLLLGTVYYSFKRSELAFEEYVLKLFANLGKTFLVYITLAIGAVMVGGIIDALFLKGYGSMSSAAYILVTGLYFAPKCIYSLEDMENEPGVLLRTLVKYIFSCMTIIAAVIIYAYMLKIIIIHEIPSNEIFSIVSALFCMGMPIWLIAQYYMDNTKYSKVIHALPYIFAPMILLQAYSMGIRIYEHGMTPERYVGFMLIIFEIATILIWHFCKKHYETLLKFLAILIVISVFVPVVNMDSVSNIWQKNFLEKYYQKAAAGQTLSESEYKRMIGAYDYLRYKPQMKSVVEAYDVYDEDFAKIFENMETVADKPTDYKSYYVHGCQMVGDIDVGGYKKLSMLNQDESYDNLSSRGEDDDKDRVDFSQFKFVIRETGEEVVVDISDFATRCMDYKKEHPDADKDEVSQEMRKYNRIDMGDGTVILINHFEVRYNEGIKDGVDYFKWGSINLGGMLLEK